MKKLLSILIVLLLITSSACGSSLEVIAKYNSLAACYGAPVLGTDMITSEKENEINFITGDMIYSFGKNKAILIAPDSADFLPACVTTALTVAKSSDGAVSFMGELLYSYMVVKSGNKAPAGFFNSMCFYVSATDQGLYFFIGEP